MAILNFCGWESGDGIEAATTGGTNTVQGTIKRTGDYALRVNPAGSTGFHAFLGLAGGGQLNALPSTWYATVYVRVATRPSSSEPIFRGGTGTTITIEVRSLSDGSLELWDGTTASSATAVLSLDTWYRLDITIVQNGTCQLQVNGGTAVTLTGLNNAPSYLYCGSRQTNVSYDIYYDDICIEDTALPGAGQIFRMDPDGNGNYTAWTGVYTDVDDVPHDSDTTYLSDATSGDAETVTLESGTAAGLVGTPKSVKACAVVRDEGGASAIQVRFRSGSTDDDTASSDPGATYVLRAKVYNTDPADAGAWVAADLDSLEVGVDNAASVALRATALFVTVWEDGVISGAAVQAAYYYRLYGSGRNRG